MFYHHISWNICRGIKHIKGTNAHHYFSYLFWKLRWDNHVHLKYKSLIQNGLNYRSEIRCLNRASVGGEPLYDFSVNAFGCKKIYIAVQYSINLEESFAEFSPFLTLPIDISLFQTCQRYRIWYFYLSNFSER